MSRIFPALLLSLALLSPAMPLQAAEGLPATPQAAVDALSLERDIHTLMRDKKALAGVALLTEDGLCAGVHMDAPFPLLSVIKFPLAVAVLEKMQHEQATLTTMIPVRAEQLHTGTHSPLRDQRGRRDRLCPAAFVLRPVFRPSRPAAMAGQSRTQGLRRLPQQAPSASRRPAPSAPAPHPAGRLLASGPSRLRTPPCSPLRRSPQSRRCIMLGTLVLPNRGPGTRCMAAPSA